MSANIVDFDSSVDFAFVNRSEDNSRRSLDVSFGDFISEFNLRQHRFDSNNSYKEQETFFDDDLAPQDQPLPVQKGMEDRISAQRSQLSHDENRELQKTTTRGTKLKSPASQGKSRKILLNSRIQPKLSLIPGDRKKNRVSLFDGVKGIDGNNKSKVIMSKFVSDDSKVSAKVRNRTFTDDLNRTVTSKSFQFDFRNRIEHVHLRKPLERVKKEEVTSKKPFLRPGERILSSLHEKSKALLKQGAKQVGQKNKDILEKLHTEDRQYRNDRSEEIVRNSGKRQSVILRKNFYSVEDGIIKEEIQKVLSKRIQLSPLLEGRQDVVGKFSDLPETVLRFSPRVMVEKITRFIYLSSTAQVSRTNFMINGGRLGNLDIQFVQDRVGNQVTIIVESETARTAMQKLLPVISDNLLQRGAMLSSLDVQVGDFHKPESESKGEENNSEKALISRTEIEVEGHSVITVRDYGYNTMEVLA